MINSCMYNNFSIKRNKNFISLKFNEISQIASIYLICIITLKGQESKQKISQWLSDLFSIRNGNLFITLKKYREGR